MYKLFQLAIFILFISIKLQAQENTIQVVYLKNGSIIHGTILEMLPDKSIKIRTKDQNIFVFKMDEVDKVISKEIKPENIKDSELEIVYDYDGDQDTSIYKNKGFTNISKFGPIGFTNLNFTTINGYHFNPYLFLGLGVSLDTYNGNPNFLSTALNGFNDYSKIYYLPIYLDLRYFVKNKRTSFLTFCDIGYSPLLKKQTIDLVTPDNYYYSRSRAVSGGLYFCPGVGLRVFINKNFGFLFDFGIKFQNYKAQIYDYNYVYNGNVSSMVMTSYYTNKLGVTPCLNVGITF